MKTCVCGGDLIVEVDISTRYQVDPETGMIQKSLGLPITYDWPTVRCNACTRFEHQTGYVAIANHRGIRLASVSEVPACEKCGTPLVIAFDVLGRAFAGLDEQGRFQGNDQAPEDYQDYPSVLCPECYAEDEETGWIYESHELEDGSWSEVVRAK